MELHMWDFCTCYREQTGVRQGQLFMPFKSIFQDVRTAVDWVHIKVSQVVSMMSDPAAHNAQGATTVALRTAAEVMPLICLLLSFEGFFEEANSGRHGALCCQRWTHSNDIEQVRLLSIQDVVI